MFFNNSGLWCAVPVKFHCGTPWLIVAAAVSFHRLSWLQPPFSTPGGARTPLHSTVDVITSQVDVSRILSATEPCITLFSTLIFSSTYVLIKTHSKETRLEPIPWEYCRKKMNNTLVSASFSSVSVQYLQCCSYNCCFHITVFIIMWIVHRRNLLTRSGWTTMKDRASQNHQWKGAVQVFPQSSIKHAQSTSSENNCELTANICYLNSAKTSIQTGPKLLARDVHARDFNQWNHITVNVVHCRLNMSQVLHTY